MLSVVKEKRVKRAYLCKSKKTAGVAFEEADIKAIKHAIENPEKLSTAQKYACDINSDGKVSEQDLTELTAAYGE